MFKFLKKLFAKEEIKEEKVSISEIEKWFSEKTSSILNDLNSKIDLIKGKIKEEIKKTGESLGVLENAKLQNPKITLREKQFMEGNREAYIKKVDSLLKQIRLEGNYEELLNFCSNFDSMLDLFAKSTIRPYHILQEFYANESRDIALNIKNLDNVVKELKNTIKNAGLGSVEDLRNGITQLGNKIRQKKENEEKSRQREEERKELVQSISNTKEEIQNLEDSEENKRLNELKADKEVVLAKIREHNGKLIHSFSVIEKALKKYSRIVMEDERLLNEYVENPINALAQDDELKIIKIIEGLEKNILSNQIDLLDKKREKTLEEIKNLNKGFFDGFLDKNKELESELEEVKGKINENKAEEKINELRGNLEKKEMEMERINSEIGRLKDEISKVDVEGLKRRLEEKIKHVLKVGIKIL